MTPAVIPEDESVLESVATFKDKKGTEWNLELSVGLIKQIYKDTGMDLDLIVKDAKKLSAIVAEEPKKLAEILWVMCAEQATAENITPEDFGRRLVRDVIDTASNALIKSIILFYPRGSAGQVLAGKLPEILRRMDETIKTRSIVQVESILSNMPTG